MKNPRFRGLNLITCIGNASRCVTCTRLFKKTTSENAVIALRQSIKKFRTSVAILSDNGSCFVDRNDCKKQTSTWALTLFENKMLNFGIDLIHSRPYHCQTHGNFERFHKSIEEEMRHTRVCLSTSSTTREDYFAGGAQLRGLLLAQGIFCHKCYRNDQGKEPAMNEGRCK